MTTPDEAALALLKLLSTSARGPRRDALFALWLTVRVADGVADASAGLERAQRRRVQALEKRLSSLALPGPLRRALPGALAQLRDGRPGAAAAGLGLLIAPATDSVSPEAGQAVAAAARAAESRVAATVRQR